MAAVNAPTLLGVFVSNAKWRRSYSHGGSVLVLIVCPSTQRAWADGRQDRRIQIWIYPKVGPNIRTSLLLWMGDLGRFKSVFKNTGAKKRSFLRDVRLDETLLGR